MSIPENDPGWEWARGIPRPVLAHIMDECRAGTLIDAARVLNTAIDLGYVVPNWDPERPVEDDGETPEDRANRVFVAGMVWMGLAMGQTAMIERVEPLVDGSGDVTGTVELRMRSGNVYHLTPVLVDGP